MSEQKKPLLIPVFKTREVLHYGSLDPATCDRKGAIQDGHCLSVSHCPWAWRRIAELKGVPLWSLRCAEIGNFIDVHALGNEKDLRSHIAEWGISNDYAEPKILWRGWSLDRKSGAWSSAMYSSRREAFEEVDTLGQYEKIDQVPGPDGKCGIQPVETLTGTAKLEEAVQVSKLAKAESFDFVLMLWAEETQPEIDGLWWLDPYTRYGHVVPRGGILPSRLPRWNCTRVAIDDYADDETGKNLVCKYMTLARPDASAVSSVRWRGQPQPALSR